MDKDYRKILGNYLKEIRKNKNITAKTLGEKTGYTQGHISGIENGTKTMPNIQFVKKYLNALTENNIEYNKYVEEINDITDGSMIIAKIDTRGKIQSGVNLIKYPDVNGGIKDDYLNVPINDLNYHLKDNFNYKYYGDYRLTSNDVKNISNIIFQYLKQSQENKIQTLQPLNDHILHKLNGMTDKTHTDEYKTFFNMFLSVNGDIQKSKIDLEFIENAFKNEKEVVIKIDNGWTLKIDVNINNIVPIFNENSIEIYNSKHNKITSTLTFNDNFTNFKEDENNEFNFIVLSDEKQIILCNKEE